MRFIILSALVSLGASHSIKFKTTESVSDAGSYIVKLRADATTSAVDSLRASLQATASHEYAMPGFRGFANSLTAEEATRLKNSNQIEYIEKSTRFHSNAIVTQEDAPWGLSRISSNETNGTTYTYDDTAGKGTCAYVVDTGIYIEHPEFEGRATFLVDTSGEDNLTDPYGHGTHNAGTIGSKTYGVAKNTKLYAVKVLDSEGDGTIEGIVAGLDFLVNNRTQDCPKGSVVNISLGGTFSQALNDAVKAVVQSGMFVAVSAGNEFGDARDVSPASEPSVCTVGATTINDTIAEFSNTGPVVDILAPGVDVLSTWNNGSTAIISGTSMSAPHVAGLGAYLLGAGLAEVESLCETIQGLALKNVITLLPNGTANLLANNGVDQGGERQPQDPKPTYGLH
ncbi:hypothetical protein HBI18_031740 [Parastagonospora nodorum]|nr:hypothetical protein HBH47_015250 [Parastagonospora nodorum]KAH5294416.1 hypothetical protein HBI11_179520 [Parastagonospora nodorum]KAH5523750.1 hypothetical protein HBI29_035030 [Parastagonospora nodorum]KAH5743078.1 hypothetical protein HBI18_031740 [Parastagonospora nodorum]KAH5764701.1 hypothetical protein HBI17_044190 [Parastagonospora nodorum]